jgi:hypothetical protein
MDHMYIGIIMSDSFNMLFKMVIHAIYTCIYITDS